MKKIIPYLLLPSLVLAHPSVGVYHHLHPHGLEVLLSILCVAAVVGIGMLRKVTLPSPTSQKL